ncbi:unnamed protein product, partial [Ectocarpus fasciculatus]
MHQRHQLVAARRHAVRLRKSSLLPCDSPLHAKRLEKNDPCRLRLRERCRPVREVLGIVRRGQVLHSRKRGGAVRGKRASSRF